MKRKIWIYPFVIAGLALILMNGCKKEDDNNDTDVPVLTTTDVSSISQSTAISGGNISSDGGTTVTERGVCWSTSQNPTTAGSHTTDGSGTGSFTSNITGLSGNTTYYVRAYATNNNGTGYGSSKTFTTNGTVTDIDGNVYNTITIGTQVWMVENLKTTKYRNGDAITLITSDGTWSSTTNGAYCYYDNNTSNQSVYGNLYNFYAVYDTRNICPVGWHIPTDSEWQTLITNVGGLVGDKLKETGTAHWPSPNDATNSSGFTALPGGVRSKTTSFGGINYYAYWWAKTLNSSTDAFCRYLSYDGNVLQSDIADFEYGYSIRCVKD